MGVTWQMSALYAVAFGGYVAFSVYLPTYLKAEYQLSQADAANRMAGFVLLAVLMRPVGGWLSDRLGAVRVMTVALSVTVAGAVIQSFAPALMPVGTIAFLTMAAALGAAAVRRSRWSRGSPRRTRSARSPAWSAPRAASAGSSRRC